MDSRLQFVAVALSGLMFVIVLELVRRRRLLERYALLWLGSSLVLLAVAIWRDLLDRVAGVVGVADPPNALFVVVLGFVLLLLLHFSVATSRLSDQTKVLAQRLAITEERLRRMEREYGPAPDPRGVPAADAVRRTGELVGADDPRRR